MESSENDVADQKRTRGSYLRLRRKESSSAKEILMDTIRNRCSENSKGSSTAAQHSTVSSLHNAGDKVRCVEPAVRVGEKLCATPERG